MERYQQFLDDIRKNRADAEKYRTMGLNEIASAFDTVVIHLTMKLSEELEQNAHVQAYKQILAQEKALAESKVQYEQASEEVRLYKEVVQTF